MNTSLKRELHAYMGGISVDDLANIMNNQNLKSYAKAELMCVALPTALKDLAREYYQNIILGFDGRSSLIQDEIEIELIKMRGLGLDSSPLDALEILPPYSLAIEFKFTLTKPYLSRDDDSFYIIDNPVRKEKVFKVPYVAPSSWKGSLRAVSMRLLLEDISRFSEKIKKETGTFKFADCETYIWPLRAQNILLFGNEKGSEENFVDKYLAENLLFESLKDLENSDPKKLDRIKTNFDRYLKKNGYRTEKIDGRQGRITLFPTFFNRIGLDIINPHERERGVGTNPILFECVPTGAEGKFALFYVPYDYSEDTIRSAPIATPDEMTLKKQVACDIQRIGEAIHLLFTVYGFGAKTSSGFGTATDELIEPGHLAINAEMPMTSEKELSLPESLKDVFTEENQIKDFFTEKRELRTEEEYKTILQQRRQIYNRKRRQIYKRIIHWWEVEGGKELYGKQMITQHEQHKSISFSRLSELPEVARQIATALGGAR